MPNIRQIKKKERTTRKWSQEAMDQAQEEVKAGRLNLRQAAQEFGVPKTSLSDRVSGRVSSDCVPGQRTLLTPADEDSLVEYLLYSSSHGFPLTKPQVLVHALAFYNLRHQASPRPWGQATPSPDCPDPRHHWSWEGILRQEGANRGIFEAPHHHHGGARVKGGTCQVYNCDETGFQLEATRRKVSRRATSASSSGLSTAGPLTPSCASHAPWLPARTSPQSLPAEEQDHLPPSTGQHTPIYNFNLRIDFNALTIVTVRHEYVF